MIMINVKDAIIYCLKKFKNTIKYYSGDKIRSLNALF